MEKIFNNVSIVIGLIGGTLAGVLGGWDLLLKAIVGLVILDYITGILKAIYTKKLSSNVGFKGLIKKIAIFVVITAAYIIQGIIKIPLREITITFFIANEGISLLENAATFIPIPAKLKSTLIQLRDNQEK